MQGIYNYTTEPNHVSKVYSAAAVLYLQFVLEVMSFPCWMFCTFILAHSFFIVTDYDAKFIVTANLVHSRTVSII